MDTQDIETPSIQSFKKRTKKKLKRSRHQKTTDNYAILTIYDRMPITANNSYPKKEGIYILINNQLIATNYCTFIRITTCLHSVADSGAQRFYIVIHTTSKQ